MKKMYRLAALLLIAALTFAAFGGCGKAAVYEVLVNDEAGDPVPGVSIQFCSDTECIVEKTGEDGIASFDMPSGSYTVHVLKVPDGFAADDTEYPAPAEPGRVTIVLK